MSKNKNKQRKEKKKKRIKHPELGRTKAVVRSSFNRSKASKPKPCVECKQLKKCMKVWGGGIIKDICKCNNYLLEIELERVNKKRINKEANHKLHSVRVLEFTP